MNYLIGTKIKLVKFTDRYITAEYLGWLNDHQVTRFLCTGRLPTDKSMIFAPKDNENFMFAIITTDDAMKYIGTCSLHKIDWISRKAEIGYMLGEKNYWGKGIATELIGLLTDYGLNRLGLNKITAGVVEGNIGSIKALKNNEYLEYGINPQDYYLEGKFLDTHLFYKLRA